jgi:UDPglucose 6-dehydrogenase
LILSFFGLGYAGTVCAICFASKGLQTIGFDIDQQKVKLLLSGKMPFYEPGLNELLKRNLSAGSLSINNDPFETVVNSDATFITVDTPETNNGSIDLNFIKKASEMIGKAIHEKNAYHLVVVKSTVIPGTTGNVVKHILENASGKSTFNDFGLAVNPEFMREGNAVQDIFSPDRIIMGCDDEKSSKTLNEIYSSFICPKINTNMDTAELIKYASNAFLAMKVSYINMIANLCQRIPYTDIEIIAKGIGLDQRIGSLFLKAGAGWGGSCWPKDLKALRNFGNLIDVDMPLITATIQVNANQPGQILKLAKEIVGDLKNKAISVLGLAFKPNTDDVRSAVSIKIVSELLTHGANVIVYDPCAMENFKKIIGDQKNLAYAESAVECIRNSDCALIVTEWEEFRQITPADYVALMKTPAIVDGRRIYDPIKYSKNISYTAIGLGPSN